MLDGLESATTNTANTIVARGSSGEFAAGVITITGLTNSGNSIIAGTLGVTGNTTLTGDLAVNGGDLTTSATTFNLLEYNVTTVNAFGSATLIDIGGTTATATTNIQVGATVAGATKTVYLGTGGVTGSTTNVYIGSTAGTSTIALQGNTNVTSNLSVAGATTLTGQLIAYEMLPACNIS